MAAIRQLKSPHPQAGQWVQILRTGRNNSRAVVCDGVGTDIMVPEDQMDEIYQIPTSALITTTGCSVKFRTMPVTIRGAVTAAAPGGDYLLISETSPPNPVMARATSMGGSTGGVRPANPVNPPPANPVNPPPANPVNPPRNTGVSDAELKVVDGTPCITVDKMGILLDAMPVNRSIMFWGPPGCGKSQGVYQWCKAHNYTLFDVRLPLLDPIDLRGIGVPDLANNICRWLPAEFIPKIPRAVLFLDEISAAAPAVQAAAYQLTLDRRIGETQLPDDCRVIAAGNRESDRGVAYRMPSPLANRFVHFTVETKFVDWKHWAFRSGIDARIISYLMLHGDQLHKMEDGSSGQAWPSPRSWQFASEALQTTLPEEYMGLAVAGCVGVKAAKDFIRHTKDFSKYSRMIPAILAGGAATLTKETDPSKCQVLSVALVCNCSEDEHQMNNAIRWALGQNKEHTSLTVRALEEKFGVTALSDLPAYEEYLNPRSVPNPSGAVRPTAARPAGGMAPPAGF